MMRSCPKVCALGTVMLTLIIAALLMAPMVGADEGLLFRLLDEPERSMIGAPAWVAGYPVAVDTAMVDALPAWIAFALPDGTRFDARRVGVERRGPGNAVWRGTLEGGEATLTLRSGYVMGLIETPKGAFELTSTPDGRQVLVRLDHERFDACGNEFEDPAVSRLGIDPSAIGVSKVGSDGGPLTKVDPANQVDILGLYTPQAASGAGGQAAIEATIQSAVDVSNTAFANSNMDVRFNLVHVEQADRNDSNNASADRNWARDDPTVQALRDVYRADMVGLLVENAGSGLCGIAFLMGNESADAFAPNGFQVTRRDCAVGNRTFAHEHGHNMGLQHNPQAGAPPSSAFRTFAYGHFVNGNYRTVMAAASSPCSNGCPRVGQFSNPNITFQGAATGITDQRDNVRTSNITAPSVANWRERFPAPSSCPTCLDFDTTGTVGYSNQDTGDGPVASVDGGATFALGGNRWRRSTQTFNVTANTVIEFEFLSTSQGEIHGIGFDEDDTLTNDTRIFQIYGTQIWASAFQNSVKYTNADLGTYRSFQIRVGDFYTGNGLRLVLVNDKDAAGQNNTSFFRNVRVFEDGGGPGPGPCSVDDDFESGAAGWANAGSATCTTGAFTLGAPTQQTSTVVTQVGGDHTTGSGNAIFTATNSNAGTDDVDGGTCVLTSPTYNVTDASELSIWYFHGQRDTGDDAGDFFSLEISINGGAFQPFVSIGDTRTVAAWTEATTNVPAGATVALQLRVADGPGPGDIVEGGIDDLSICPQ